MGTVKIVVPSIGPALMKVLYKHFQADSELVWRRDVVFALHKTRLAMAEHIERIRHRDLKRRLSLVLRRIHCLRREVADLAGDVDSDVAEVIGAYVSSTHELAKALENEQSEPFFETSSIGWKRLTQQKNQPGAPPVPPIERLVVNDLKRLYAKYRRLPVRAPQSKFLVEVQHAIFMDHGWYVRLTSKDAGGYQRLRLPADFWTKLRVDNWVFPVNAS